MKNFFYKYAVVLSAVWSSLIFALCAMPGRYIPEVGWMALLSVDKLVHAGMFFILGILIILAGQRDHLSHKVVKALFFLAICYGALLEVMQATLFSERSMEVWDVVANTAGVLLASLFFKKLSKHKEQVTI